MTRVLDIADPARGQEAGEFQGRLLGASVSVIVMSVTNSAERIAGEVIDFHRLPTPLIWIEHFEDGGRGTPEDPHTFDMVTFASYEDEDPRTFDIVTFASYEVEELGAYMGEERKRIGEPSWKPLDRATVEALIGEEA